MIFSEERKMFLEREKMCARHFDELALALKKKGMWHLVAKTKEMSTARATRWLTGKTPEGEFDPLIVASLEIYKKAHDSFGVPEMCPLCAVNKVYHKNGVDVAWIDNITDLMLASCLANNLMVTTRGRKIIH